MNVTPDSNTGGWNNSYMRNTVCTQFKNALPADLQAVLKTVTKWTDNTDGGSDTASYVTSTTDIIFLLSEFEVHGARSHANSAEQNYQTQYQYYINGNNKVKYRHSATGLTTSSANYYSTANSYAFAPEFCV